MPDCNLDVPFVFILSGTSD